MAARNGVWGIDVGQCALKAVKLRPAEDGRVEIVAFDVIEHPKLLSQPDAEPDELIHAALEKFVSRNDWQGDEFVIGVPGQQTFARFCKLPPVETKKIPDIVKFEASQQIPFEMDDVVWDYEVFQTEDSPDIEVGIFAMRKDLIRKHLGHFGELNVAPQAIQTMPSALYNFCRFDLGEDVQDGVATVIVDVGAQNTDLVIVEPHSAWTRNIPLGGNNFTEALVKAFKLSFAKAESLKRTAATSKYARQIFQAMRPIFAELVAEIQRSLGFYSSTHRDVELKQVLACGNAFRLPGLQKYLENNLTISGGVRKLEKFQRVVETATINAPQFTDNLLSFGVAYGLALQGIGLAHISANLLPPDLARIAAWKKKRWYFAAAAACTALAMVMPWARTNMDMAALASNANLGSQAKAVVSRAQDLNSRYDEVAKSNEAEKKKVEQLFELQAKRGLLPKIYAFIHEALPEIDPALVAVSSPEELKNLVKQNPQRFARVNRRQILIDSLELVYAPDIDEASRNVSATGRASGTSGGAGAMGGGARGGGVRGGSPRGGGMQPPGMGMMPTAGRERRTTVSRPDDEPSSSKGDGKPGFVAVMKIRILCGEDKDQAIALITRDFYDRLLTLSQENPELGFFVPRTDPLGPDQRNLDDVQIMITKVYDERTTANAMGGARGGGFQPPTAEPVAEDENVVLVPDPITGEDMITDWQTELVFKIKLGRPPQEEKKDKEGDDSESTDNP